MSRDLMLPCPTCNGDQFVSHGDRHVENRTERCPNPDCYEGKVPAKTGQTPQTSAGPGTDALLSDPLADLALLEQTERRLIARSKDVPTWDREYREIETEVGKVRCQIAEVRLRLARVDTDRDPGAKTRATLVNTGTPQVVSPHSGD